MEQESETITFNVENILSTVLLNLNIDSIDALSSASKSIQQISTKLLNDNYHWKLMLEKLLHLEQLSDGDGVSYKECYDFVIAIDKKVNLMFTKTVFYAKLGLTMSYDTIEAVTNAVMYADVQTVQFLLNSPSIYRGTWRRDMFINLAINLLRSNVVLLLARDGRCFIDDDEISNAMIRCAETGLSDTFFYLIRTYPNVDPEDIEYTFEEACATGSRDIVDYILSLGYVQDRNNLYSLVDLIEGKDVDVTIQSPETILTLIEQGHITAALKLIHTSPNIQQEYSTEIDQSIHKGIHKGRIADILTLESLIKTSNIFLYWCIVACIDTLTIDYTIGADSLAVEFFKMLRKDRYRKNLVNLAYAKGKVGLSKKLQQIRVSD